MSGMRMRAFSDTPPSTLIRKGHATTWLAPSLEKKNLKEPDHNFKIMIREMFTNTIPNVTAITEEEYLAALSICITYECQNNIEVWRTIPFLKGRYSASNLGKIKSHLSKKTPLLKASIKGENLYMNISLGENVKMQIRLDYLIASTFLKKSNNCKKVTHKDGDTSNCNLLNLSWK